MRLPNAEHEAPPWRIHEIVPDFTLEDVWALPVHGSAEDFERLLAQMTSFNPTKGGPLPARALWALRDLLGRVLGIGRISGQSETGELTIPGTNETSLAGRLPEDLVGTAAAIDFSALPFEPLFRTADEFAAEIGNQTVHGVLHIAWVEREPGRFQGQMAVYVKPRGTLGHAYMALIKPFRYWVVYPPMLREMGRAWRAQTAA